MDYIPTGFKFTPTKAELINYYLKKKILKESFEHRLPKIFDADVYRDHPRVVIHEAIKSADPSERRDASMAAGLYFFTKLKSSTEKGKRNKNRQVKDLGTWEQQTNNQVKVKVNGEDKRIGYYKYYKFVPGKDKPPEEDEWQMHEYSMEGNSDQVLCHIVEKDTNGKKNKFNQMAQAFYQVDDNGDGTSDYIQKTTTHIRSGPSGNLVGPSNNSINNSEICNGYGISGYFTNQHLPLSNNFVTRRNTYDIKPYTQVYRDDGVTCPIRTNGGFSISDCDEFEDLSMESELDFPENWY